MKGNIYAKSVYGKGSSFTIIIPSSPIIQHVLEEKEVAQKEIINQIKDQISEESQVDVFIKLDSFNVFRQ